MILLNDEEVLASMGASSVHCYDCGMNLSYFHTSNKAQLKKVVEWLEGEEFNLSPENLSGSRLIPFFALEALKKEAYETHD
ncbi:unnamed protein product [marine sediment metagenome]|uniref:Uncharacterized protein n=1 Tax=marine sediment metagenome TaxID=412755 RepID=X1S2L6_9ZZZZ